jgi:hypothetical protein
MTQRIDILDERESVRTRYSGRWLHARGHRRAGWLVGCRRNSTGVERWGDPKSLGGGAVGITAVDRIPLPSRQGRVNPVANDTESQVPSAPVKPQPKQAVREDPKAIAIKSRNAQKTAGPPQFRRNTIRRQPKAQPGLQQHGQAMQPRRCSARRPAVAVWAPAVEARSATASAITSS